MEVLKSIFPKDSIFAYSYKTNYLKPIIKFLNSQKVLSEVVSPFEVDITKNYGIPPGRIIYNGPIKNLTKYNKILGKNYFKNRIKFSLSPSLEAQIASISDDIAYNSHDLEDGLKSNLFKLQNLENIPVLNLIVLKHKKKLKNFSVDLIIRQIVREIINVMVQDIIKTTQKNGAIY